MMTNSMQIPSNCYEAIGYELELVPTYSSTSTLLVFDANSTGQPFWTLSSHDIQENELYKALLKQEYDPITLYSFNISTSYRALLY